MAGEINPKLEGQNSRKPADARIASAPINTLPRALTTSSIVIGDGAISAKRSDTASVGDVMLGNYTTTSTSNIGNAIVIGNGKVDAVYGLKAPTSTSDSSIVIGSAGSAVNGQNAAMASGLGSISIGSGYSTYPGANSNGSYGIAIGTGSTAGYQGICIGGRATATGSSGITIGMGSNSTNINSISIGAYSTAGNYGISVVANNASNTNTGYVAQGTGTINLNWVFNSAGFSTATNCILMSATSSNMGTGFFATPTNSIFLTTGSNINWGGNYTARGIQLGDYCYPKWFGQVTLGTFGFGAAGDSKTHQIEMRAKSTTNATTKLWLDSTSATVGTNGLVLSANSVLYITGSVIAKGTTAANIAVWDVKFSVSRQTDVASIVANSATITQISSAGTAIGTWVLNYNANTSTGSLDITGASGGAFETIYWFASLKVQELNI